MCVTWNSNYSKLTTSDENGLIIVWMLHKGMWYEEMINNRGKSVVRDMKWTSDGQKICIVYEDGAVIVGSVDGNRLWGKELDMYLQHVEWSPDGKRILFVTNNGAIHIYDAAGAKVKLMQLPAATLAAASKPPSDGSARESKHAGDDGDDDDEGYARHNGTSRGANGASSPALIADIDWYDGAEGYVHQAAPTLAIAFVNGTVQIGRHTDDASPVVVDAGMRVRLAKWSTNGAVLAVSGSVTTRSGSEKKEVSTVKFYTPYGDLVRVLKVPGAGISSLSWEGGGLRIALAVDAYIYFANIRPDYMWGYAPAANVLAFSYQKPDRAEACVALWDLNSQERHLKMVRDLKLLRAAGENALLVSGPVNAAGAHAATLCNAIGSPLEVKHVALAPRFAAMTTTHVVIADARVVYVWQYRTAAQQQAAANGVRSGGAGDGGLSGADAAAVVAAAIKRSTGATVLGSGRERILDPSKAFNPAETPVVPADTYKAPPPDAPPPQDPISAVTANETTLVVACESGLVQVYGLPLLSAEGQIRCRTAPTLLALNCDGSLVAAIDRLGMLTILDLLEAKDGEFMAGDGVLGADSIGGAASASAMGRRARGRRAKRPPVEWGSFERKDTWDVRWSEEDPDQFAVMEKTRLVVFNGLQSEEPVSCNGYVCQFKGLCVKTALLDQIMASPESLEPDWVTEVETKALSDAREVIASSGLAAAYADAAAGGATTHRRLWQLIAESALEALELDVAERAFVGCGDYQGIQFVKRVMSVSDRVKQRAEVSAYFQRYDESEALYRNEMDRKDLAIDLRQRLGDWFRVVHLVKQGGADDQQLIAAWDRIGDYYSERGKWGKASQYYKQARNMPQLVECYLRLEEYSLLGDLIGTLPADTSANQQLLAATGKRLQSLGQATLAATAFVKAGDVKAAIDSAVLVSRWDMAVELAAQHEYPQMEGLVARAAAKLLSDGDRLQAVELYRKAGKASEAALLLAKVAEECGKAGADPLRAKKLHVLAALEVERHRRQAISAAQALTKAGRTAADVATATAATMDTLMATSDDVGDKRAARVLDSAWRGAEAYHYYMLAQRQLYQGQTEAAMRTAIRCCEFEDVLDAFDVYALVALAAYHCSYFGVCSKAFVKLETLEPAPPSSAVASTDASSVGSSTGGSTARPDADAIQTLAVSIFTRHQPVDPQPLEMHLRDCLEEGRPYQACTVTGQVISSRTRAIMCRTCRHFAAEVELRDISHCPLCHSSTL
eukprot:TRINITY_DN12557_c0_g2_i1.p1 TRINITY_DN12557_c0_g2~~TRINITY_DN12557_c0_g2_i1.p1  ORF type:complete len:1278 (+),score=471.21 TRINITY_DN12557_c0_g2_i1:111-3836(+)